MGDFKTTHRMTFEGQTREIVTGISDYTGERVFGVKVCGLFVHDFESFPEAWDAAANQPQTCPQPRHRQEYPDVEVEPCGCGERYTAPKADHPAIKAIGWTVAETDTDCGQPDEGAGCERQEATGCACDTLDDVAPVVEPVAEPVRQDVEHAPTDWSWSGTEYATRRNVQTIDDPSEDASRSAEMNSQRAAILADPEGWHARMMVKTHGYEHAFTLARALEADAKEGNHTGSQLYWSRVVDRLTDQILEAVEATTRSQEG